MATLFQGGCPLSRRAGQSIQATSRMQSCEAIIANMTPFRGVGIDPGTSRQKDNFVTGGQKEKFVRS